MSSSKEDSKSIYEQIAGDAYVAPTAETYKILDAEDLLTEQEAIFADYYRYAGIFEYHQPTAKEAARRLTLIHSEILTRINSVKKL